MTVTFQQGMPPNPHMYTDFGNPPNFWIGAYGQAPSAFHTHIDQFCAILATHWLTHGCSNGGLTFAQLSQGDQLAAVQTLTRWAGSGGLAAQVQYATSQLGGTAMDQGTVLKNVAGRTFNNQTRIWFGTDVHAEAAQYAKGSQASDDKYLCYDPNTGRTTQRTAQQFADYIRTKNAFVVRQ